MYTSLGLPKITWKLRLKEAFSETPWVLVMSVAAAVPGVLGLIYGDGVSKALSVISVNIVSRLMATLLLIGGLTVLYGILRGRNVSKVIGLTSLSIGFLIYGCGAILGLGLGGMVTGPLHIGMSIAATLSSYNILRKAKKNVEN